jgi:hypothetical protein
LNKAIAASRTDYLIFIDGDCVAHQHFVKEHIFYQKQGVCLTGRRVNLSENITQKLTAESIKKGKLENKLFELLISSLKKESNYIESAIYFKNKYLRKWASEKQLGVVGCNFSLFKQDLLNINGFDERYKDTDVQFRLELQNVKIQSVKNLAIQYHLFHTELPRLSVNQELFEQVQKEKIAFTAFGIEKS